MKKRVFIQAANAFALAACLAGPARAQSTPIKFQLDWRFEGPAALFLAPAAKGYFKDAKLDVSIDAGNGYDYLLSKRSGFYAVAMSDKITGLSECSSYSVGVRHRFQAPQ